MEPILIAAVLGLAVGLVMGLTGAGGTILAVPLLMWGLDKSLATAAPVALLAVAVAGLIGTIRGLSERIVRWRAAGLIGCAGLLSAPLGVWLAPRAPDLLLTLIFAVVLLVVAWRNGRSAWRGWRHRISTPDVTEAIPSICRINPDTGRFFWNRTTAMVMAGIGLVAGLLSGLIGVGGGFIVLPALLRYSNVSFAVAAATTLMVLALISTGTVLITVSAGRAPDFAVAAPFVLGAVGGLLVGQRLAWRLPLPLSQGAFALLVLIIALSMLSGTV
jgi:uncharacterized membrane protein YfcA